MEESKAIGHLHPSSFDKFSKFHYVGVRVAGDPDKCFQDLPALDDGGAR